MTRDRLRGVQREFRRTATRSAVAVAVVIGSLLLNPATSRGQNAYSEAWRNIQRQRSIANQAYWHQQDLLRRSRAIAPIGRPPIGRPPFGVTRTPISPADVKLRQQRLYGHQQLTMQQLKVLTERSFRQQRESIDGLRWLRALNSVGGLSTPIAAAPIQRISPLPAALEQTRRLPAGAQLPTPTLAPSASELARLHRLKGYFKAYALGSRRLKREAAAQQKIAAALTPTTEVLPPPSASNPSRVGSNLPQPVDKSGVSHAEAVQGPKQKGVAPQRN